MKKNLVWVVGLLLLLSFVFPNGLPMPVVPVPAPVAPDVKPTGPTDATIIALLLNAPASDKAHVAGVYTGLSSVVARDAGKRLKTTEQWAELQSSALQIAVDGTQLKGKYVGLDVALDAVFDSKLGKEKEVVVLDDAIRAKILEGCAVIVDSTR